MRNKIILLAFALAYACVFCSCDRKAEFQSESFATFETASYAVSETAGTFKIPVTIYNPTNRNVRVMVEAYDDTAEQGVNGDYNIVYPENKLLDFAPGESTKEIEIELNHDKQMTGSKYFTVVISSSDPSFKVGELNTVSCKIKDNEHPLSMFIGDWVGEAMAIDLSSGTVTPTVLNVSILEDENDETYKKLRIKNLDPVSTNMSKVYTLRAKVNDALDRIEIANEQPVGYDESYGSYYVFYSFKITSQGVNLGNGVTLYYDKNAETLTVGNIYGTLFTYVDGIQYIGSIYDGGAVLRKKELK